MESIIVLGLSVSTRMQGLAVVAGNRLVDYHIQLRKDAWTPHKGESILASLQPWCMHYSIKSVALSIPYEKQTSAQTKELLESLNSYFRERKIRISPYHTKTLYSFCKEAKAKKEIMKTLAHMYPELSFHYQKEMRNKNKYYIKLFEAVGVATMHLKRLIGKNRNAIETGL